MDKRTTCGTVTIVDMLHAMAYAVDQVNRQKCNDPDIINKYAGQCNDVSGNCFVWKNDETNRLWPKPCLITDIKCDPSHNNPDGTNKDCINDPNASGGPYCSPNPYNKSENVCQYCPTDVQSGHCHIKSKNLCIDKSFLPYDCSGTCCEMLDSDDIKGQYLEWRPNITCSDDIPCVQGGVCVNGKCTCTTDDNCPGGSVCKSGVCQDGGRCVLGNWALKQWAENPKSRCPAPECDSNPTVAGCSGNETTPGVTDVPPFYYNDSVGKSYITQDYCRYFANRYTLDKCDPKLNNSDCQQNGKYPERWCHTDTDGQSYCTGSGSDCHTDGQKVGSMFVGNTLFRLFADPVSTSKCINRKVKENYEPPNKKDNLKELFQQFNTFPDSITKLADSRLMTEKLLVSHDFISDGIHLYIITWKSNADISPLIQSGLDADEVEKIYPQHIIVKNGTKYITISKNDIKNNNQLKRLYLTLNTGQWFRNKILKATNKKNNTNI